MKIKFKKLHLDATPPLFGSQHAAAMDIFVLEDTQIQPHEAVLIPTGIAIEIPVGHMALLALRSSGPIKHGLYMPHGMGIIDSDYRGELKVQVAAMKTLVLVKKGEKIAQMVIIPARSIIKGEEIQALEEVAELSNTARGAGGFGSTGHK